LIGGKLELNHNTTNDPCLERLNLALLLTTPTLSDMRAMVEMAEMASQQITKYVHSISVRENLLVKYLLIYSVSWRVLSGC
jgi:hypothetical protein